MPRKLSKEVEKKEEGKEVISPVRMGSVKVWNEIAIKYGITDKQLLFCQIYANDPETRGNGVQSYAKAYNINLAAPGKYNYARMQSSVLLSKEPILNYIKEIFEHGGYNDQSVQQEHLWCIKQMEPMTKLAAVKLYYEITGKLQQKQTTNAIQFNINIEGNEGNISTEVKEQTND